MSITSNNSVKDNKAKKLSKPKKLKDYCGGSQRIQNITMIVSLPAARLGISTSLTTLIAAELPGTMFGLGNMIQKA